MQRGENMKDDGCTVCKKGLIEHIENRRSPDTPNAFPMLLQPDFCMNYGHK